MHLKTFSDRSNMKKIIGLTLGIACLAAALGAHATTAAELSVRGTIKPAACNLTLTGAGVVNYGDIPSGTLLPGAFTPLQERTVPLSITCASGATKFGLTFKDLQSASKVPGILNALGTGYTEAHNYGLGMVSARKTGGFAITLRDLKSSGTTLVPIMRASASTTSWQTSDGKAAQSPTQHSWRSGTPFIPATISQLSGTIAVRAVINRPQDLDLSRDVTLDGRASLELNYI
jgi:type 1 fimbria pilin